MPSLSIVDLCSLHTGRQPVPSRSSELSALVLTSIAACFPKISAPRGTSLKMFLPLLIHHFAYSSLVTAQVGSPSIPPAVVSDRAEQGALDRDSTPCNRACAALASLFPSQLFLEKTGDFVFFDSKQSSVTPNCRVEPSSAEDVSTVLKTVVEEGCHFAVKSGGHSRERGASNVDGGVTIDLVRMNDVKIGEGKNSATIGAGARWGQIYKDLEAENLMVIGGRVGSVGIGGLILGGGLSFYSAEYGFACDNVMSYKIVLPNSTVTQVTEYSHPDLFFALRGVGSINFGIIASFTLETFQPQNPAGIWYLEKTYSGDVAPRMLEEVHTLYSKGISQDQHIGGWSYTGYFQEYDMYFCGVFHTHTVHKDTSTHPPVFQPFMDLEGLPNSTSMKIDTLSDITGNQTTRQPNGKRNIYVTFTFHPNLEFQAKATELWKESVESIKDSAKPLNSALVFHPLSRRVIHLGNTKRGGNALGIEEEEAPLVIFQPVYLWEREEDDELVYAAYHAMMEKAEGLAKNMGVWHRFKYVNYAEASQDVYEGYGKENLERLVRVQKAVDPRGVFARGGLGGGYFKLPLEGEKFGKGKESGKRDEL